MYTNIEKYFLINIHILHLHNLVMVFLIWLEMVFGIFILECGHVRSATHNSNYSMLSSSLIPNFKLSVAAAMDRG